MCNIVRKPRAAPWALAAVLTAAVCAASADRGWAAEPAPPPPDKKLTFRDIQLTVHARKALADDIVLGPANLGVRVQDNVAILWGPVPSEDVKRRAVEVVKKVKGVFEVHDADIYIAAPAPTVEPPPPPPAPEAPTRTESASPDPVSGTLGLLTGQPAVDPSPVPLAVLRPPLPLNESGPAQTVSAAPPGDDLSAAVELVRQGAARFHAVDCRLEGDVVVLRQGAGRGEDLMAFARAISHLPGLSRIVVRNDEAAPR